MKFDRDPAGRRAASSSSSRSATSAAGSRARSTPSSSPQHGLDATVVQANTSFNVARGTLRGMHYPGRAARRGRSSCAACAARSSTSRSTCARTRRPTAAGTPSSCAPATARRFYIPRGLSRTASRRSPTTREVHYLMGAPLRARGGDAACAGTTRRSGSTWPEPRGEPRRCPSATRLPGLRAVSRVLVTGARGVHRPPDARRCSPRAATRSTRSARRPGDDDGRTRQLASGRPARRRGAPRASSPHVRRRTCCTSPGTPSRARSGRRPRTRRWVAATVAPAAGVRGRRRRGARCSPGPARSTTGARPARCARTRRCAPATLYGACKDATRRGRGGARGARTASTLAWGRVFFLYGPGEPTGAWLVAASRARSSRARRAPTSAGDAGARLPPRRRRRGRVRGAASTATSSGAVNIGSGERCPGARVSSS